MSGEKGRLGEYKAKTLEQDIGQDPRLATAVSTRRSRSHWGSSAPQGGPWPACAEHALGLRRRGPAEAARAVIVMEAAEASAAQGQPVELTWPLS